MAVRKTKNEPIEDKGWYTQGSVDEMDKFDKKQKKIGNALRAAGYVAMGGITALPALTKKSRAAIKSKTTEIKKNVQTKKATNKADRLYNKASKLGSKVQTLQKEKPGSQKLQRKTVKANEMLKRSTAAQSKAIKLRSQNKK